MEILWTPLKRHLPQLYDRLRRVHVHKPQLDRLLIDFATTLDQTLQERKSKKKDENPLRRRKSTEIKGVGYSPSINLNDAGRDRAHGVSDVVADDPAESSVAEALVKGNEDIKYEDEFAIRNAVASKVACEWLKVSSLNDLKFI